MPVDGFAFSRVARPSLMAQTDYTRLARSVFGFAPVPSSEAIASKAVGLLRVAGQEPGPEPDSIGQQHQAARPEHPNHFASALRVSGMNSSASIHVTASSIGKVEGGKWPTAKTSVSRSTALGGPGPASAASCPGR